MEEKIIEILKKRISIITGPSGSIEAILSSEIPDIANEIMNAEAPEIGFEDLQIILDPMVTDSTYEKPSASLIYMMSQDMDELDFEEWFLENYY